MTVIGVLQARMTSSRLPGKVLLPVLDQPMIGRQIERLSRIEGIDRLVVATSWDQSDDTLANFLEGRGVEVVRGPLDDVLARFAMVLDKYQPEVVVRLTADCPLVSPIVADRVIKEFRKSGADYVSNTLRPTFPDGLDVEVVRAEVLRWAFENCSDLPEREHVTLGVYRRPEKFLVQNVAGPLDYSKLRWTVDEPADLEFVRWVYGKLYVQRPEFEFEDVLELIVREPEKSRTVDDAGRNVALRGIDTGAMDA